MIFITIYNLNIILDWGLYPLFPFLIQYKWQLIIIGEALFLVFISAFFIMRYWFHQHVIALGAVLLLIVNELFLALLAIFDYMKTGKVDSFQIITILFFIYLLFEGKKDFRKLDLYFKRKVNEWKGIAVPVLPQEEKSKTVKYGRIHAKQERRGWYEHLLIFIIAQIIFLNVSSFSGFGNISFNSIGALFKIYEDEQINKANSIWGIILVIDFIWSFSYTLWPRKEKGTS